MKSESSSPRPETTTQITPRGVLSVFKAAGGGWIDDHAMRMAAALAYYTLFSLAPLLIIAIAVAGLIFGEEASRGELLGSIRSLVGEQAGEAIQTMVSNAGQKGAGVMATILGVVTLVFGATGVFAELQDSLNSIWKVELKPGKGIRGFVRNRLLSMAMVLGVGFLLLTSLIVSSLLAAAGKFVSSHLAGGEALWQAVNFAVSLAVVAGLFAMIYKLLPDVRLRWRDVIPGALVTAVLFTVGKLGIGLYLGKGTSTSVYGAAGSLVVVLVWTYYSSMILFFGAELTKAYAFSRGYRLDPIAEARIVAHAEEDGAPVASLTRSKAL